MELKGLFTLDLRDIEDKIIADVSFWRTSDADRARGFPPGITFDVSRVSIGEVHLGWPEVRQLYEALGRVLAEEGQ